jgi:transcriptional regulator GlxA family with amidase domain
MNIAFVVFDGMTTLDFLGAFDALTRLKTMGFRDDIDWQICARTPTVQDGAGLILQAQYISRPLADFDLLLVPGGFSTRHLELDESFLDWLRTAESVPRIASVCTGSLLLGAAGFLRGRVATTHPSAFNDLARYCARVSHDRIVEDGPIITARGVTSSIDLGLHLVGQIAGSEIRERIRRQMDYSSASSPSALQ